MEITQSTGVTQTNNRLLSRSATYGIAINFAASALTSLFYFFSIYFVDVLKLNISLSGILMSCYGVGTVAGGYLGGKLADKFNAKTISAFGLLGTAVAFTALANISSISLLVVDLFLLGLANYLFITSNYVYVLGHSQPNEHARLKAINYLNMASNLGIGIAAITIGALAKFGYGNLFRVSGFLLLLLSAATLFKTEIPNDTQQYLKSKNETTNIKTNTSRSGLILALCCLIFTGMIVSQLGATYPVYLKTVFPEYGTKAFSTFFSINTFIIVLFQNRFVNMFVDYNRMLMIGCGSFLLGAGMFLLSFPQYILIIFLSCFIYSAGEMIFFSNLQLYCYQHSSDGKKGKGMGIYRATYATSRLLGPTIGGAIYYYFGGVALWSVCGAIGSVFLIICARNKNLS